MDDVVRIAIIGAGSMRCTPPVIASLATYFGERPIELRLYDADEERLDLVDRFARYCFSFTESTHEVLFRPDPQEAMEKADRVVLQVGRNCARKFKRIPFDRDDRQDEAYVAETLEEIMPSAPPEIEILSLQRKDIPIPCDLYRRLEWPPKISDEELRWLPHQILRWLRGEEYAYDLFKEHEHSPFKAWLNDPNTAEMVISRALEP